MNFQPSFAVFCALASSVFAACIVLAFIVDMIDARILERKARPVTKRASEEPSQKSKDENGPQLYL
jgi:hypothetical protein